MASKIVKKAVVGLAVASVIVGFNGGVASAHVVVKPAEVGVGAFQTFTTGVPNEKDGVAVSKMRLVIPDSLNHVSPNVKPGWTIDEVKTGEGEDAKVTEITWSGGSIPAGQRDDFAFSAQVPAKPTSIQWKAYQTYEDGTEVSWDQAPTAKGDDEAGDKGPYSVTKVVDDVTGPAASATAAPAKSADNGRTNVAIALSVVALLFSFFVYIASKAGKVTDKK